MNTNEEIADNLRWWLNEQRAMIEAARERIGRLQQIKQHYRAHSANPNLRQWFDDAIEREQKSIDELDRSVTLTMHLLSNAENGNATNS